MKKIKAILLAIVILCSIQDSKAQFKFDKSEFSILISDNQLGIPFVKLLPIRLGLEVSATVYKKEKTKTTRRIAGHLGYIHLSVLIYAPYLKATYDFEFKIKETFGIDTYAGIGYLHGFFPGAAYRFNESTQNFESTNMNQAFFMWNFGLGFSYLKPAKVKPFLKYNVNFLGFSPDFRFLLSSLHLGVKINLLND